MTLIIISVVVMAVIAVIAGLALIMNLIDKKARISERNKSLERERGDSNETARIKAEYATDDIDVVANRMCKYTIPNK